MGATRGEQLESTPLYGGNADYVEALYEQFLGDPASVDAHWRDYFGRLPSAAGLEHSHRQIQAAIAERARQDRTAVAVPQAATDISAKQGAVSRMIQIYSNRGHLVARLDPLGLTRRERPKVLDLEYFGLSKDDLDTEFFTGIPYNFVFKGRHWIVAWGC